MNFQSHLGDTTGMVSWELSEIWLSEKLSASLRCERFMTFSCYKLLTTFIKCGTLFSKEATVSNNFSSKVLERRHYWSCVIGVGAYILPQNVLSLLKLRNSVPNRKIQLRGRWWWYYLRINEASINWFTGSSRCVTDLIMIVTRHHHITNAVRLYTPLTARYIHLKPNNITINYTLTTSSTSYRKQKKNASRPFSLYKPKETFKES